MRLRQVLLTIENFLKPLSCLIFLLTLFYVNLGVQKVGGTLYTFPRRMLKPSHKAAAAVIPPLDGLLHGMESFM